jgi:hypothetical protein
MLIPYTPLEKGVWYWRYRVNGGTWTPYFSFQINKGDANNIPPDVSYFISQIPTQHPRILTNKYLPLSDIESENADRQAILLEANEVLGLSGLKDTVDLSGYGHLSENQKNRMEKDAAYQIGYQAFKRISLLCQAYLLTGKEPYFQRAKEMGLVVAGWDRTGYSGMVDFSDAKCMLGMALVFDTFYDKLSEEERLLLVGAIQIRAKYFYELYKNDIETKILSGHFWQHILHFLFQTNLILYQHVAEARDWLAYDYEIFFARAPILSGETGGWMEGLSYFTMNMETLVDIPFIVRTFTGYDFFRVHPFYKNMASWLVYHVPPGAVGDGFADNATHLYSPGLKYQAFALEMAKLTGVSLFKWYADQCRKYEPLPISKESTLRWFRLAKSNQIPMPPNGKMEDFPIAKLFADGGVGSMQTRPGMAEENLALFMRASPIGAYGHLLAEQNTFNISHKGKRIFFKTGYKLGMDDPHRTGWSQLTKSANGILINGKGQVISTEGNASFLRLLQGSTLAYVKSDASNAYKSVETKENFGIKKFVRHYLLLPPDIIMLYDELESEYPARWQWLLHAENDISVQPSSGKLISSDSCTIDVFASLPLSLSIKDSFDVPLVNFRFVDEDGEGFTQFDTDQKHITLQNEIMTDRLRIGSIFSFGNAEVRELKSSARDSSVRFFRIGDWEMNMGTDPAGEPLLELKHAKKGTFFSMFGNPTASAKEWGSGLVFGNSYLWEKGDSNHPKSASDGEFRNP